MGPGGGRPASSFLGMTVSWLCWLLSLSNCSKLSRQMSEQERGRER